MAKKTKPKKTCRCKCGRKYRPERMYRVERLASGKIRSRRERQPTCVGLCKVCYKKLLDEIENQVPVLRGVRRSTRRV